MSDNTASNTVTLKVYSTVLEKDANNQSITVRYWTDIISQEELRNSTGSYPNGSPLRCRSDYNLNIWNNIKTENDLKLYIEKSAPVEWFNLMHKVKDDAVDTSLSVVDSFINFTNEKIHDITHVVNPPALAESPAFPPDGSGPPQQHKELSDSEIDKLLSLITSNSSSNEIGRAHV